MATPAAHCMHASASTVQAGRGHLKQLMSDLEGEQERAAGLVAALDDTRARLAAAEGAKEVAEARMARAQKQVAAANEAAAELEAKAVALAEQLQASRMAPPLGRVTEANGRMQDAGSLRRLTVLCCLLMHNSTRALVWSHTSQPCRCVQSRLIPSLHLGCMRPVKTLRLAHALCFAATPQSSEAEAARLSESLDAATATATAAEAEGEVLRCRVAELQVVAAAHEGLQEEHHHALERVEALEAAGQVGIQVWGAPWPVQAWQAVVLLSRVQHAARGASGHAYMRGWLCR